MPLTYKDAGVDIDAGNLAVSLFKKKARRATRPEVLSGIGGFAGLFALGKYREPVLVSGTDGVGTKLKIAFATGRHGTIGHDVVAMCVNDILTCGAEPLFFLDYLAVGKLDPAQAAEIVGGIAEACEIANCALLGGETAEMPGFYSEGEYDVAGFAVGVVERDEILDGSRIEAGDVVLGLPSSGLHSNGYSLARRILLGNRNGRLDEHIPCLGKTLGEELLTPTRIYVRTVLPLVREGLLKGMAHITGGGFLENIPRILPENLGVRIFRGSWPVAPIFNLLQEEGQICEEEMYRTFNMGIGMALITDKKVAEKIIEQCAAYGEKIYLIGEVTAGKAGVELA